MGLVEDTVESQSPDLRTLQTKIRALEYKAEDAENGNMRNNLHIVGLAEWVDGLQLTEFVEKLLRTLLPAAQFSPFFYAVERAHHILPKPGPQGAPSLKFLNFRDRDEVLRAVVLVCRETLHSKSSSSSFRISLWKCRN